VPPSTIRRPGVAFIHFTRVCYPRTSAIPMHPLGLAASGAAFGRGACGESGQGAAGREGEKSCVAIGDERERGVSSGRRARTARCAPRKFACERWPLHRQRLCARVLASFRPPILVSRHLCIHPRRNIAASP